MIEKKTLARPYAEAMFELAQASGRLDAWSQMLAAMAVIAADRRVLRLEDNPRITHAQIVDLFQELCGTALDPDGANFLRLLLENRRLSIVPNISALFEKLKADAEQSIEAEVISAMALTAEQEQAIAAGLKKKFGREISLVTHQDPSLLGGVIIRAGDVVIDGSVKGRLQQLASQLNQ